jgi:hypothetical protein
MEETAAAFDALVELLLEQVELNLVIRPHAREHGRDGRTYFGSFAKSVKSRIHFSNDHALFIAKDALATVSFGGTVACDAVAAGCPVVEVLSSQAISRSEQLATSVARFGLAVPANPTNLRDKLLDVIGERSEVAAFQNRNLHALYRNINDPHLHRETIVKEILRLQQQ